jgi:hypothetical protein
VNEVNVVEPVPEEELSPVEVGFDICGTDLEPEIPVEALDAYNPSLCFTKFTSLMLMPYALGDRR